MTTMQTGGFGSYQQEQAPIEQRTSVLAILSLIFGLICIVPGLGVVGALLGILALALIGKSNGRVVGNGLAAAGIVVSLIVTMAWLGAGVMVIKMGGMFNQAFVIPCDATMKAIDTGDFVTAKKSLSGTTAQKITDADFAAFQKAYKDELGSYKSAPAGMGAFISGIMEMGPAMNNFKGQQNLIPMPLEFEKGKAVAGWQINPKAGSNTGSGPDFSFTNIQITTKTGKTLTLYDPDNRPVPADGSKPPEQASPAPTKPAEAPVKPSASPAASPTAPSAPK